MAWPKKKKEKRKEVHLSPSGWALHGQLVPLHLARHEHQSGAGMLSPDAWTHTHTLSHTQVLEGEAGNINWKQ